MGLFRNENGKLRAWLRLLMFYAAAAGAALALMIALAAALPSSREVKLHIDSLAAINPWLLAFYGLVVLVPVAAVAVAARGLLDGKAPLASLGLRPRGAPAGLSLGFGGGVLFLTITCGLIALAGGAGFRPAFSAPAALAAAAGPLAYFAVLAATEELALRGYPIKVLDESWGRAGAVLSTSLVFSLLHLLNPGAGVLPLVNVALAGAILALLYLQSGSLWLAIGFHWGWNFAEGGVFGFPVSGVAFNPQLLKVVAKGPVWLSGGSFGPEGSVALTVTSAVLILLLLTRRIPYPKAPSGALTGGASI
jgi:membrane protease YdiL (CAAX protease family)